MKTVVIVALFVTLAFARSATKERISRLKCQEYNELLKKNNICNKGYYPFVGALGSETKDKEINWFCSGVLISNQYVLTVAHCATTNEYSPAKYVRLGGDFSDNSKAKIFNISKYFLYPEMKVTQIRHDIALFKLEKPVDFNEFIQPACLYSGEDYPQYDVAGFNFRSKEGQRDKGVLVHEIDEVATKEECSETYDVNSKKFPEGVNLDIQFCSEDSDISCEGNSAGVFVFKDEELSCMQNILGLYDFAERFCPYTTSGVSGTVSAYFVDWIENIVWS